ncbi:hypothetical protein [Tenacibaculum maritimum]|uniref:hypothetical protein n=1 Tax=Tenacibaculum maritimum TaxID=107401 RepID=UPI0012E556CC|nr:hypothetical protein [Tenacibaculum maritimum]MDB0602283.1 hypothetical protein [Tenacibaculum maritimum]MDB0612109.1 hypothetical protein [Tenacibaculum maritimum]CAA0171027.1 hypothetical protein TFA04_150003 [Tenacibaculum maritimum]
MTIIERLSKYMAYKGLNANKVTVEANLSVGLIGKSIKKNTGLNSETIEKILYTYTDLNAEWFVIGKGEMLKTEDTSQSPQLKDNKEGSPKDERNIEDIITERLLERLAPLLSKIDKIDLLESVVGKLLLTHGTDVIGDAEKEEESTSDKQQID